MRREALGMLQQYINGKTRVEDSLSSTLVRRMVPAFCKSYYFIVVRKLIGMAAKNFNIKLFKCFICFQQESD